MTPSRFIAAYALDLAVGDPQNMPHPVRWMGRAITAGERRLNRPDRRAIEFLRGAALSTAIVAGAWIASRLAVRVLGRGGEILLAWTTLATRSLLVESHAVLDALERDDIANARTALSRIVGRDTASLDEPEILRGVIETVAEGLCDGVIAPMMYLAAGGVPLAMGYKAVNTLDSIIGHHEPRYLYFGRAAAKLDDAANFIPARLAAIAIVAAAAFLRLDWRGAWVIWGRDGAKHLSPNAGHSEAAMAGALGVRLGGMNFYDGEAFRGPELCAEGSPPSRKDARNSFRVAGIASLLGFSAALAVCLLRGRLRRRPR